MTTERWNFAISWVVRVALPGDSDEKLDRLADIVSGIATEVKGLTSQVQGLTEKLQETTNIANTILEKSCYNYLKPFY